MSYILRHLNAFAEQRVDEICAKVVSESHKYRKLGLQSIEIQNEITANTPDEIHFLLLENECLETAQEAILQNKLYKQGIIDGIGVANFINKFNK